MHNQPYVGCIALCTRKKLLKSGEIRHFYGISYQCQTNTFLLLSSGIIDVKKTTSRLSFIDMRCFRTAAFYVFDVTIRTLSLRYKII